MSEEEIKQLSKLFQSTPAASPVRQDDDEDVVSNDEEPVLGDSDIETPPARTAAFVAVREISPPFLPFQNHSQRHKCPA